MLKRKPSEFETKFEELEPSKIIDELSIESKAKTEAEKKLPLEDSTDLDVNEFDIKTYITKKIKDVNDLVINKKTVYNKILFRVNEAISKEKEIALLPEKYKNDFMHYIEQAKSDFEDKKAKYESIKKDLINFKHQNNIDREEVSSKRPYLNYGLLIIILMLESIANATFFAKANELGLIGGFTQAVLVSIVNAFMAFFALYLFRKKNIKSISSLKKNIIFVGTTLLVLFIFIFHLLVGHFRDALGTNPEKAYEIALNTFTNNPIKLIELESWLLILMGVFLFVIFLYDFAKLTDPYPGYTNITRRYEEEKKIFDRIKHIILSEIKNDEEQIEKELKNSLLEIKNIFNEARDIPNFKKSLQEKYNEQLIHANNVYNLLIKRYRSINLANREGKPKYFDRRETLDGFERIEFELDNDVDLLLKLEKIVMSLPELEQKTYHNIIETTKEIKLKSEFLNG